MDRDVEETRDEMSCAGMAVPLNNDTWKHSYLHGEFEKMAKIPNIRKKKVEGAFILRKRKKKKKKNGVHAANCEEKFVHFLTCTPFFFFFFS